MRAHPTEAGQAPPGLADSKPPRGISKEAAFWILNAAGWFLLCAANIHIARMMNVSDVKSYLWCLVFYGSAFVIAVGCRHVYRRIGYRSRSFRSLALAVVLVSLVAANLWRLAEIVSLGSFYPEIYGPKGMAAGFIPSRYVKHAFSNMWPFMMWSILYFGINFWAEWRREQARAAEAIVLAQKAHLQMLRYQINPHFLFNALNSIRALVDENTDGARAMITDLADFLRYSLLHRDYANVPLASEMEAVGHYLSIQSRRYEEKLEVSAEISEEAGQFPVPCFLIHPLVENAIKYGMQTSPMPLRIAIRADVVDGALRLLVSNTGAWVAADSQGKPDGGWGDAARPNDRGTGTGLENVRQRLASAFPGRHRLSVREHQGRVAVELEIRGA
jgi:two-component system LytT family sensor kinase